MRALTPIGRPVSVERREGADRGQREAEQDDERRDQRVEGQHHHHVDEEDGDAHRDEEVAERLVLLLGDAGQLDVDAGRDLAGCHEAVDLRAGPPSRRRRCRRWRSPPRRSRPAPGRRG